MTTRELVQVAARVRRRTKASRWRMWRDDLGWHVVDSTGAVVFRVEPGRHEEIGELLRGPLSAEASLLLAELLDHLALRSDDPAAVELGGMLAARLLDPPPPRAENWGVTFGG